jgi:anti-sigma B factor antagonist
MKITSSKDEGVVILSLKGKITIGDGDVALRQAVGEQLELGQKSLLLDLKGVKALDSSGLGELISCKSTCESQGAVVKLLHVEDKVQEILEMTRLIGIFETFDDRIDAVASFRS